MNLPLSHDEPLRVCVIGGGPAGLMAAEVLAAGGARVDLYDAMPSMGRKFLLAGKGGLNLTHAEPLEAFCARYRERRAWIEPMLHAFGPQALRDWARGLGIETFVGSSNRVFPRDLKAAPLLRAWLSRLRGAGVALHARHRWQGWTDAGALRFATPRGELSVAPDAVVLALGGASWSRLGSDGAWLPWLAQRGVDVAPLRPANCGFDVAGWTDLFRTRHAGQPMKTVALSLDAEEGAAAPFAPAFAQKGEFVITETGIEGSLVYAASALIRQRIDRDGGATVRIDLLPQHELAQVRSEVARPRGSRSLATHLKSRLHLDGVKAALLHELLARDVFADADRLAAAIKAVPLRLLRPRPIDEAISSAGGVRFEAIDGHLMLRALPGVYCAGEMLDWEAPTGGYLLTASIASGVAAARGVLAHRRRSPS